VEKQRPAGEVIRICGGKKKAEGIANKNTLVLYNKKRTLKTRRENERKSNERGQHLKQAKKSMGRAGGSREEPEKQTTLKKGLKRPKTGKWAGGKLKNMQTKSAAKARNGKEETRKKKRKKKKGNKLKKNVNATKKGHDVAKGGEGRKHQRTPKDRRWPTFHKVKRGHSLKQGKSKRSGKVGKRWFLAYNPKKSQRWNAKMTTSSQKKHNEGKGKKKSHHPQREGKAGTAKKKDLPEKEKRLSPEKKKSGVSEDSERNSPKTSEGCGGGGNVTKAKTNQGDRTSWNSSKRTLNGKRMMGEKRRQFSSALGKIKRKWGGYDQGPGGAPTGWRATFQRKKVNHRVC